MLQRLKTSIENTISPTRTHAGVDTASEARATKAGKASTSEPATTFERAPLRRPNICTRLHQAMALSQQERQAAQLRRSCGNDPLRMLEATKRNMAR